MKEEQRRLAMKAWCKLFALTGNEIDAEDQYFRLMGQADAMERAGLISSDEWKRMAQ
jgi:hypothetical protein